MQTDQKKFFKASSKILEKINPYLLQQLNFTDPSDLEFCWTQQEELNLKRHYGKQSYFYHSNINAKLEAFEWFNSLDKHSATVIFIYGIGLGYYYQAAKTWLKSHPHHALVFLEQDLGVLHRLFETQLGTEILKDPQVQIVFFRGHEIDRPILNELSWHFYASPFLISALKLYEQENPKGFHELRHQIEYHFAQKKALVDEYLLFGIAYFRNFYFNLLELPHAYLGTKLFNKFAQMPAIICGAGPSLNKHIGHLNELKERALVFGAGSALNALIPKGIIPHLAAAIDPFKPQYSRVAVAQPHHVPFFYRNRLFHEALRAISGPRLYLPGAGAYDIADWFDKELNIESEWLDEGQNVVNFSIQIAQALGCNPIILIGVDLAYTDQQVYAEGIIDNLNLTVDEVKSKEIPFVHEDINGQPIYTLWKWINESEWISNFAETHPEVTIINATEGGIGFKDVKNMTLKEAVEQYLQQPITVNLEKEIAACKLTDIHRDKIVELIKKLETSLHHCIHLLSRLIEEGDVLEEKIKNGSVKITDISLDPLRSHASILFEHDLEGEIFYRYVLEMFNKVFTHLHHRDYQDLQNPKKRLSKKKNVLKQLDLRKQRLVYLRDAAHCNRELIHNALEGHFI